MRTAALIQVLADTRERLDNRLILGNLAVKHAQWVCHRTALTIGAHFVFHRIECFPQCLVKTSAVSRRAYRIQLEIPVRDTKAIEQRGQHFQYFRISCGRFTAGRGWTNDLGAYLIKLAIAALLWTLSSKLRTDVVELVEPAIPELVLDVGAHGAGSIFGAERE